MFIRILLGKKIYSILYQINYIYLLKIHIDFYVDECYNISIKYLIKIGIMPILRLELIKNRNVIKYKYIIMRWSEVDILKSPHLFQNINF